MSNMYEDLELIRQPPHSIEAEQSVLGGMMIDSSLVDEVREIITPADFFAPKNRIIYEAITRLADSGDGIDLVTVCGAIPNLGDIGGPEYVAEIAVNTPTAAHVKAYAKAVKRKSQERAICSAGMAIADFGYDTEMAIDEKIASAQQAVMSIGETQEEVELSGNQHLLNWVTDLDNKFHNGDTFGLSTGFKDLDTRLHGLHAPDLVILAARPAMGKSTLAFQMAAHAAFIEESPTLVFSLEMSRKQIYDKMVSSLGNILFDRIKKVTLQEDDWPKLSAAVARMKDKPLYIDDRGGLHINQIAAACRRINRKEKLGLVVVDYLQLVRGDGDNRTGEVGHVSRMLKSLAKEIDCPVVALSQLSRKVEERPNKRPINSDLRDSGEIEQDADIIVFIYRDEVYNEDSPSKGVAEIIFTKFRGGEIGTDYLNSDLAHSRFKDLAHPYTPPPPPEKKRKGGFAY